MCVICDGGTFEDELANLHQEITDRGFALMPVGSSLDALGLVYTIGLIDGVDHPELVVAGFPLGRAASAVNYLACRIVDGERIEGRRELPILGTQIGIAPVHERHLTGNLMARWHWYYDQVGRWDLTLRALQIRLPDGQRCYECQRDQPRLDRPAHSAYDLGGPHAPIHDPSHTSPRKQGPRPQGRPRKSSASRRRRR